MSKDEKLRIDAWLAKLGKVRDGDFWLEAEEEEILFQKITGNASLNDVLTYPPRVMNRRPLRTKYWIIVAAGLLALLAIMLLATN